ncbi:ribosomal protein L7/L12 [Novosphingobium mangrovi (ex Huang et al. 2023)]|uniref:Ribosomal protein L7/L12 n=1 Tax=Novosphingobium mangrovi (ex Huang et al. 2023) TaxID=2976432 RepID=A0ABT2I0Q4_9SPHN|nr:ribosomal protein L7/L12 [Novosphingobium mangrovi (ex Huang et al. 2023)]MCT2398379.1 ribosomal protein L7/L12 [Novosphingobium mangrovi (ex Huang et al. 2023)]
MTLSWPLIALVALAIFVLGWLSGRTSRTERDLSGPPATSQPPTRQPRPDPGPSVRAEIEAAIAEGRKIEAIKLLREATGMGLKEAKEAVEAMERR